MYNHDQIDQDQDQDQEKVYSVIRGTGIRKFGQLYRVYDLMDTTGNLREKRQYELFLANLRKPLGFKPYFSYKGGYTKNTFKVDKPILLTSIGFFGPYWDFFWEDVPTYKYTVKLKIEIENFRAGRYEIGYIKSKVEVPKEEIFYIDFKSPLLIRDQLWHNILFELDGPVTCVMEKNYLTSFEPEKVVDFDFFLGSRQMPILKFKLA